MRKFVSFTTTVRNRNELLHALETYLIDLKNKNDELSNENRELKNKTIVKTSMLDLFEQQMELLKQHTLVTQTLLFYLQNERKNEVEYEQVLDTCQFVNDRCKQYLESIKYVIGDDYVGDIKSLFGGN